MPVRCSDCNHHFLLDGTTVVNGISCPGCGGNQLERDQPSPTHSDGDLKNMVDPATQLDQGGNPLQEGVWAGVDGGWQPAGKRDEFFAKAASVQSSTPSVMSSHDPKFYISMEPHMPWTHEAETKESFLPLLAEPLVAAGGRMLLGAALGGLMRKAVGGAGNYLQGPQGAAAEAPYEVEPRPVSLVASERTAVGVGAPVETPHSIPDLVEDHDPESVDQQEFNDGDTSPAFNNPNNDDAEGGLSMSQGEDGVNQKLEFRHDGDGVTHAEMILPLILEYINSDKSGLENPHIKALHEQLEKEIPDYLNLGEHDEEVVNKFLDSLKNDHRSSVREAAIPIPQVMTPCPHCSRPFNQFEKSCPSCGLRLNENFVPGPDGRVPSSLFGPRQALVQPMQPQQPMQQQGPMPGTFQNPVQPGGMPVGGRCQNCGGVLNADGSCPQCGSAPGANQLGNMEQGQQHLPTPGIMPSPYARSAADHQGPITPQQKEVFAQYLIQQGRNDEVAAMISNPGLYADEWAQFINQSTQPPQVDPNEQPPQPQVPPDQMGQMPVPGMSIPQPTSRTSSMGRCPKCKSATTSPISEDGAQARCHRCGHIWDTDVVPVKISRSWKVISFQDNMTSPASQAPAPSGANPIAAPAADATAPGDREQQADSTLSWQDTNQQPLQVGQTYEMHNPNYAIPDVVKVEAIKPDGITVTMVGEYNAPSDPQDANGPNYTHEIDLNEMQTEGLTFVPTDNGEGDAEQSQDNAQQDGIGQTVNTEPVAQPGEDLARHTHVEKLPTDHCPKCSYKHVTSSYVTPELMKYECFKCAHEWEVEDKDPGADLGLDLSWIREDDSPGGDIGFDPRALAMASTGKSRNIADIADSDPRRAYMKQRLNDAAKERTAGAKFSPREQKDFIDEDGIARNADLLNLEGTHYESAFDNSKARPDRVNDNYLGLGL